MNRFIKPTAAAALALVASAAFAAPTMDANIELDTDFRDNSRGTAQAGRVEFNVGAKTDKGGFVAGRASFLAKKDSSAAIDDMWVQFGNAAGDIKLGRFEAADLFFVGKDTVVEDDGIAGYRNVLRGRFGDSTAHAALTLNAGAGLAVELGVVSKAKNTGFRPVVKYSAGGVTAHVGFEDGKDPSGVKVRGYAVAVGFGLAGGAFNVSYSDGKRAGVKSSSLGVNATFGPAGIGYIRDKDAGVKAEDNIYAAYSLPLFGTGATVTPAIAYSKSTGDANTTLRVRVNYTFFGLLSPCSTTHYSTPKVYNRSHSGEHNPTFLLTTKQHIVDRGYSTGKSVNQHAPQTKCVPNKRIHTSAHERIRKHQPLCQLQLHPLTSERFHALLNSLFKVLFNFPSRYLFAIGLVLYVALDGVYHPIRSAFPSKPTLE